MLVRSPSKCERPPNTACGVYAAPVWYVAPLGVMLSRSSIRTRLSAHVHDRWKRL